MSEKSDVGAIMQAFSHETLALILAHEVRNNHGSTKRISLDHLRSLPAVRARVAVVQAPSGADVFEVKVTHPQRRTGYYLIYDAEFVRDRVAWWNDERGRWQGDHRETAEILPERAYSVIEPLAIAIAPLEEVPDGQEEEG